MADVGVETLAAIDAKWPGLRPATDVTVGWRWTDIVSGHVEVFTLLDAAGEAAGIWCSTRKHLITLPSGQYYRLDFVEVSPTHRGTLFGGLVFGIIAERALELGAVGLVFATWDTHIRYYAAMGGRQERPTGWTVPKGLVPFWFDARALVRLKEMADEFIAAKSAG